MQAPVFLPFLRHFWRWIALSLFCFSLSGCLFWRLHRTVIQCRDTDRYFRFSEQEERFKGELSTPLLFAQDLIELTGIKPEISSPHSYTYTFSKQNAKDRSDWTFEIYTNEEDKISAFSLPPAMLRELGKDFLIHTISDLGEGEISLRKKTFTVQLQDSLEWTQIDKLLGEAQKINTHIRRYPFSSAGQSLGVEIEGLEKPQRAFIQLNSYKIALVFPPLVKAP